MDGAISIGLYDPPRSIIDAFRMRATEGHELGYEALRRWPTRDIDLQATHLVGDADTVGRPDDDGTRRGL